VDHFAISDLGDSMTTSIDRLFAYQIESRHFPGALVHVERAGKVLAHQAVGLLKPESDVPMHDGALLGRCFESHR
jgi:hypothetical protein